MHTHTHTQRPRASSMGQTQSCLSSPHPRNAVTASSAPIMCPFSHAPGWVAVGVGKCKQMKEWISILPCWE